MLLPSTFPVPEPSRQEGHSSQWDIYELQVVGVQPVGPPFYGKDSLWTTYHSGWDPLDSQMVIGDPFPNSILPPDSFWLLPGMTVSACIFKDTQMESKTQEIYLG